jgi:hypothetical protein
MANPPRFVDVCADLLRSGASVRFRATGSSMSPGIRHGDVLTVEPLRCAALRTGEVAVYLSRRGLTAHRVVGTESGGGDFRFRGDAQSEDEAVRSEQLLGRVVAVQPRSRLAAVRSIAGRLFRWLRPISCRRLRSEARVS